MSWQKNIGKPNLKIPAGNHAERMELGMEAANVLIYDNREEELLGILRDHENILPEDNKARKAIRTYLGALVFDTMSWYSLHPTRDITLSNIKQAFTTQLRQMIKENAEAASFFADKEEAMADAMQEIFRHYMEAIVVTRQATGKGGRE